ncbi:MAG TPA: hypothetical protein VF529_19295 [Solirubrobacteraceae bacterium]|jgi:hypothetical protein
MEAAAVVQASHTEDLIQKLRRSSVYRDLIPLEAAIGLPLPRRRAGKAYMTLVFAGMPPAGPGKPIPIYPPFGAMTLHWRTGTIVSYLDLDYERLWPPTDEPVGTFPHPAVAKLRHSELIALRAELMGLYDELFESLESAGTFDAAWAKRFSALLDVLMEPGLVPYYRKLAPKFIARFLGDDDGSG